MCPGSSNNRQASRRFEPPRASHSKLSTSPQPWNSAQYRPASRRYTSKQTNKQTNKRGREPTENHANQTLKRPQASLSNVLKRPSQTSSQTSPASHTRLDHPSIVHKHPPTPRQHLTRPSNVTRTPPKPHKNPRTFPKPPKPRISNPPMALAPTATSPSARPTPRHSGLPIIHSRMRRASAPAKAALGTL